MGNQPKWLHDHREAHREFEIFGPRPVFSRHHDQDFDEDPILSDKAFNRHQFNDGQHVSPYDNGQVNVGLDGLRVKLVQGSSRRCPAPPRPPRASPSTASPTSATGRT